MFIIRTRYFYYFFAQASLRPSSFQLILPSATIRRFTYSHFSLPHDTAVVHLFQRMDYNFYILSGSHARYTVFALGELWTSTADSVPSKGLSSCLLLRPVLSIIICCNAISLSHTHRRKSKNFLLLRLNLVESLSGHFQFSSSLNFLNIVHWTKLSLTIHIKVVFSRLFRQRCVVDQRRERKVSNLICYCE